MSLEEARSGSMAKRPGVQNKGLAVGFIRTLRNHFLDLLDHALPSPKSNRMILFWGLRSGV